MHIRDSKEDLEYSNRIRLEAYIIDNQTYLYRLAYSYVKNKDDALEIVQNVIYKSLSSVKALKNIDSIKPWITRILINCCFDFIKSNSRTIIKDEVFEFVEDKQGDILDRIALKKALYKLPTKLKTILILRFFEDFKIREISEILDMNESTVKTNLYKALNILKIDLQEGNIDEW